MDSRLKISIAAAILWGLLSNFSPVWAVGADKENCLMCHKYPYLGRMDETGRRITYHVDPTMYAHSVHRSVGCRECHTSIRKIPHDPISQNVDCATACHVRPPFADDVFSHRKIADLFNSSVHAPKPEDTPEMRQARPDCKYCHLNPLLARPLEERISYERTLKRCLNCHQQEGVTRAYMHVTHRLRKKTTRLPVEIDRLCADCHADQRLLAPFQLSPRSMKAVATYSRSIHGQAIMLGSERTADCLSCHASNALHDIFAKEDPRASINANNLRTTCRQCHQRTNDWFVNVAVHPETGKDENPVIYIINLMLRLVLYGTMGGLMGLLLLETFGRKRNGIRFVLYQGSSWRGHPSSAGDNPS